MALRFLTEFDPEYGTAVDVSPGVVRVVAEHAGTGQEHEGVRRIPLLQAGQPSVLPDGDTLVALQVAHQLLLGVAEGETHVGRVPLGAHEANRLAAGLDAV